MASLCCLAAATAAPYAPSDPNNEFEQWTADHVSGPILHKARHYFAIYERHFRPVRTAVAARQRTGEQRPLRMLEIGVQSGGSLELWKSYFGEASQLLGLDINPATERFTNRKRGIKVHLGSTSDAAFMHRLVRQLSSQEPLDIVIDDGSHHSLDIWRAFTALYPLVRTNGGVYLVEDLHTNYWMNGEFQERGQNFSFVNRAKALVDEMNAYDAVDPRHNKKHFRRGARAPLQELAPTAFTNSTASIHFYNGVVVIEKQLRTGPFEDVLVGNQKTPHHFREHKRPEGTPAAV